MENYRQHPSGMLHQIGWLTWWFLRTLFRQVKFENKFVDDLKDAHERGQVVHVMQTRSVLDYLFFNVAFLLNNIPLARFANGVRTVIFLPWFKMLKYLFIRKPHPDNPESLEQVLMDGDPAFLFFQRYGHDGESNEDFINGHLQQLISWQLRCSEPLLIVPQLLTWDQAPDGSEPSFIDDLLGTRTAPGYLRKVYQFIMSTWQAFFLISRPHVRVLEFTNLKEFIEREDSDDPLVLAGRLKIFLLGSLEQERSVIVGPRTKSREVIIDEVMASDDMQQVMSKLVSAGQISKEGARKRAKRLLYEISADPNMLMTKFFSAALSRIWYTIFSGMEYDEEGLNRVREVARNSNVVLVPSHRSHIDYLIVSYLFYHSGMFTPLIAAGKNLSFWPMGFLFRKAGAFFIRRSFGQDELYKAAFRLYLINVLNAGNFVEFFIEGGRSRSGKLRHPRFGMLRHIISAHCEGKLSNVVIVPISISYDRIIEASSYLREEMGHEKESENLAGLLKTTKVLASKHGRLFVQFAKPISVSEYFGEQRSREPVRIAEPMMYATERPFTEGDKNSSGGASEHMISQKEMASVVRRLGYRILYKINSATLITPVGLMALVLLNVQDPGRSVSRADLIRDIGTVLHFLLRKDIRFSPLLLKGISAKDQVWARSGQFRNFERDFVFESSLPPESGLRELDYLMGNAVESLIDEVLKVFASNESLITYEDEDEIVYQIPERKRVELSYYKNTILHFFVSEALVAAAIVSGTEKTVSVTIAKRRVRYMSRLLKREFFYPEKPFFDDHFKKSLSYFRENGWIDCDDLEDGTIRPLGSRAGLEFFRGLLVPLFESYWLMASHLRKLDQRPMEKKDFVKKVQRRGKMLYRKGRIRYLEALSRSLLDGALDVYTQWELVSISRGLKGTSLIDLTPQSRYGNRCRDLVNELSYLITPQRRSPDLPLRD